jgi:hypothetical protein
VKTREEPYYNVVGARIIGRGAKIQIHTLSVEDAIDNNPDLPVDCDGSERYAEKVEMWRTESRELDAVGASKQKAKGAEGGRDG